MVFFYCRLDHEERSQTVRRITRDDDERALRAGYRACPRCGHLIPEALIAGGCDECGLSDPREFDRPKLKVRRYR